MGRCAQDGCPGCSNRLRRLRGVRRRLAPGDSFPSRVAVVEGAVGRSSGGPADRDDRVAGDGRAPRHARDATRVCQACDRLRCGRLCGPSGGAEHRGAFLPAGPRVRSGGHHRCWPAPGGWGGASRTAQRYLCGLACCGDHVGLWSDLSALPLSVDGALHHRPGGAGLWPHLDVDHGAPATAAGACPGP